MGANIGPGIEGAYRGFFGGLNAVRQVERNAQDDAWQDANRQRAQGMWAEEDALNRQKLQSHTQDLKDMEEVRPQVKDLRTKKLAADSQKLDNAQLAQGIEGQKLEKTREQLPQALADSDIVQHLQSAQTASAAMNGLMELGGRAYAAGDTKGITSVMGHLTKSGLIDSGGMGNPVSSQIINIPKTEGALDFAGQPIAGQAIKITTDSGAEVYVNPTMMSEAYKRQLSTQDAAGAKMVKPGEKWVTPTGRVIAQGEPRLSNGMYVDPDTNEVIDMRPRTAGAGGSAGSGGKGAKAQPTVADQALAAFETIAQKGDVKLTADQIASGQVYAERAARSGLTANEAGRVAHDVAVQGSKALKPYLDPNTLTITGAFSHPEIQGGKPVPLAPGNMSLQEFASTAEGKSAGQSAVTQATELYVRNTLPNGNTEQRKAVTDFIDMAARDQATYDKLMAAQKDAADPAKLQALQRLIDAKRVFGLPAAKAPSAPPAVRAAPMAQGLTTAPTNTTQAPAGSGGLGGSNYRSVMESVGADGLRQAFSQPYAPGTKAAPSPAPSPAKDNANTAQEQAAKFTPDYVRTLGKEDVRAVLNNAPLMRQLNQQIKQQLQYRFSGVDL